MPNKTKKTHYTTAVGRRKTSRARIRLHKGKGDTLVNDLPISQYFPGKLSQLKYLHPQVLTNTQDKLYATIKVEGGGKNSQLQAVTHGLARALEKYDPKFRTLLKPDGLLKRDPRAKERRKAGLAQSARAKKQSPKR